MVRTDLLQPLPQAREQVEHHVERGGLARAARGPERRPAADFRARSARRKCRGLPAPARGRPRRCDGPECPQDARPSIVDARAAGSRNQAGDHLEQRGLAGAIGAENDDDLAATDVERHAVERAMLAVEGRDVARPQASALSEIGADHLPVGEHGGGRPFGDLAAGIHHHAAVAKRANGVHHMLDDDDGQTFLAQHLHQRDADLQFGWIEAGEPLVEQQNDRRKRERAGQLEPLLVDIGELRRRRVRLVAEADAGQQARGRGPRPRRPRAACA